MQILIIHHRFPGQFKGLIEYCLQYTQHIVVICQETDAHAFSAAIWAQLTIKRYGATQANADTGRYAQTMLHNSVTVRTLLRTLKSQGFYPKLSVAHIGFGDGLFIKDVFPNTCYLAYCEYYYPSDHAELVFDPEFINVNPEEVDIKTPNAYTLLALNEADAAISPTQWQKNLFPQAYHHRIEVIHEGVDIEHCKPDSHARFTLADGRQLRQGEEILTYATRNLEPYRGFHQFIRAAALLMARRPKLQVLVAGGDDISYSTRLALGQTYREKMLAEVSLDSSRIHFVGHLSFAQYCQLLQVSAVHVYLTIPFVLSWSLLEAMASQCAIVASDTAPVTELLQDNHNALLADFLTPTQIAAQIERVLLDPNLQKKLSANARRTIIEHYDRRQSIQQYEALLSRLGCSADSR